MKVMEIRDAWGLENLRTGARPDPIPGEFDVIVEMQAASINYRDVVMVRGGYGRKGGQLPMIPVSDGAGKVVATGKSVTRVKIGDMVCPNFAQNWFAGPFHENVWAGMLGGYHEGVLQQFMLLPELGVVKAAPHLSAAAAASLPCAALTAWSAIADGGVKPGDTVLTQGTGGVSLFALQFAKLFGARVIVTSSSDDKLKRASAIGADETINYRTFPDWQKRAREIAGPTGIDHVVELAGDLDQSVKAVKAGGTLSVIGVLAGPSPTLALGQVVTRAIRLLGVTAGSLRSFEDMMRAIEVHRIEPTFSIAGKQMEEAPRVIAAIAEGSHFGKICMEFGRLS
ncbi:NADPH:quinone reductase-like Zn-dependent oxidoreductase [Afipia massiliensis]|uniref:NADPH:quinone reductase-like Zn-dependent oxidoreductase n=1 Tax=Afipia massiliensis TaxID=211460 RepID=A0A840N515_9BRAD|nr:NAD(P)-dependent alcohol dehydrogenase [Afipia massiliensis]MBB5055143.1 NADPH:quinone reductase-like Zn-dependent oxidoreductase [Afipia massiliensis]